MKTFSSLIRKNFPELTIKNKSGRGQRWIWFNVGAKDPVAKQVIDFLIGHKAIDAYRLEKEINGAYLFVMKEGKNSCLFNDPLSEGGILTAVVSSDECNETMLDCFRQQGSVTKIN